MFAPRDRVTVRSHAGQDVKGVVVCRVGESVNDSQTSEGASESGAWLVRTSSGRRVVSSAQMSRRDK